MDTEQYINKLFSDAGWQEDRNFDVQGVTPTNTAHKYAVDVLSKYGNLNVGEVGAGRDLSASDISFRSEAFDFTQEFYNYWEGLSVSLYAFASAHRDHMLLLVDDNNDFYIFTGPNEQLYKVGNFQEILKRVLLGINYGVPLEKA